MNERLHPGPPPFAEVLTGGGDRGLPESPRAWGPSSTNTSVSGRGSGRRPLLSVRVGMHTRPVVIADGGEVFGETAKMAARVQGAGPGLWRRGVGRGTAGGVRWRAMI